VLVEQNGQAVPALTEAELTVQAEERDVYLEQNTPREITLYARHKGGPASAGTRVLVALYDNQRRLLPSANQPPEILQVGSNGTAKLPSRPTTPCPDRQLNWTS
jgi:hypothetical protein